MKQKNALIKISALLKATSFTSQEARKLGVTAATLAHYVKTGDIERIGHGIYRGKNAKPFDDFRWEDLYEAVTRTKDGVICLISALALYDLTEEIPRQHWIAIENKTMHRTDASVKVVRMRNIELGRTNIDIGGMNLPIFDRERTIVDAFRYLSIETAIKALKFAVAKLGKERIDVRKITSYAEKLRVRKIMPYLISVTT